MRSTTELLNAILSGIAAITGLFSCLAHYNERRKQIRCRLRFDDGTHSTPKMAPHLRLDVENSGGTTVCVKFACVVLRADSGKFLVYPPFSSVKTPADNSMIQPGCQRAFLFFQHRESAREATKQFWRLASVWGLASVWKKREGAIVRLSDDRVFHAEPKEAKLAIDFFLEQPRSRSEAAIIGETASHEAVFNQQERNEQWATMQNSQSRFP